ncbi:MAG: hypothetical protein CL897_04385 [Dehalococcoidia bacterium]|nr:hypothetical protein [Dehalococcoidia bacterium]
MNMRKRLTKGIALPVLSVLVLVGLFACGDGGDSKPLEARAYRDLFLASDTTLQERLETEGEARLQQFEEANDYPIEAWQELIFEMIGGYEDWSEENLKELSRLSLLVVEYLELLMEIFITFSDEQHATISSLEPPSHLAQLHNDLLAAYRDLIDSFRFEEIEFLMTELLPIEDERDAERFFNAFVGVGEELEALSASAELQRLCWEMEDALSKDLDELVSLNCGQQGIGEY